MNATIAAAGSPRLVPRPAPTRDRVLPIVIAVSLFVHATILALLPWHAAPTTRALREIPIELVQMPPPAAPPAKPAAQAPPAVKPAEKPAAAKASAEKASALKTPAKKALAQKPPAKPEARKTAAEPRESVAERMKDLLGPMPTSMPAVAIPGESTSGTDVVSYSQLVLSKLAKAKKEGRHRGTPGRSTVAFSLGDTGEVVSVALVRPSGDATLDEEAIAMVHRGEPFPVPPIGGRRDYQITLVFSAMP